MRRTKGYNDRIREEIARKYGPDAFQTIRDEAWKETHPPDPLGRNVIAAMQKDYERLVVYRVLASVVVPALVLWICTPRFRFRCKSAFTSRQGT
jgi:hypothetical protein